MIQLSPDTAMPDFKHAYKWAAGYQYGDPSIMGFSHTHFSGSGHSDLGDVLVMPIAGEVKLDPGDADQPGSGYRSRFSHDSEVEQAGYYAVTLSDYDVRAELTAGRRVGWHRYTFPTGKPAHLLLDLRPSIYDYDGKVLWSQPARARRRHRHRLPPDQRLGARARAVLRHALQPADGLARAVQPRGQDALQGLQAARATRPRTAMPRTAARWSACSTSAS